MDTIAKPQLEKLSVEILAELSRKSENLQDERWIRMAWDLALQNLLETNGPDNNKRALRKKLEEVWGVFLVIEIVDSCLGPALAQVLGFLKPISINWKKPLGVILIPPIWQAAVDQTHRDDDNQDRNFQVTATDADGKRLQKVLSKPAIQLCNKRMVELLQSDEIWSHADILMDIVLPKIRQVVDGTLAKTLEFVDQRKEYLLFSAVVPVATYAMTKPTISGFVHDSKIHFEQMLRSILIDTGVTSELASSIGAITRTRCRNWIQSPEFKEQILPNFVNNDLALVTTSQQETGGTKRSFFQRFRR